MVLRAIALYRRFPAGHRHRRRGRHPTALTAFAREVDGGQYADLLYRVVPWGSPPDAVICFT
ncbi:MAG: hypothetical protein U0893_14015 [Chloroflexota bacterium]